jgi:uncharacterized protein YjbI with pentapeptide repeats
MLESKTEYYNQRFEGLVMVQETLTNTVFENCIFESCDFSESTFNSCIFQDCQFVKSKLTAIRVKNSKFSDVKFYDSKVLGVDWTKAYWRGLNLGAALYFERCLVNASSFYGLKQSGIVFDECRAHDMDFREATLSRGRFAGTDLTNSLFMNSNLSNADFNGATNFDIDITKNTVKGATFDRYEAVSLLTSLGIKLV